MHFQNQEQEYSGMNSKEKASKVFYQNYCELIEYLNDLALARSLYLVTMALPALIIFGDLIAHIDPNHSLQNLANLSLSRQIIYLMKQLTWTVPLVKTIFIVALLLPFFVGIVLTALSISQLSNQQLKIGQFYRVYAGSKFFNLFRFYFNMYQRVAYPILVSIGIKLTWSQFGLIDLGFGVLLITLAIFSSLIFHYYTLEVSSNRPTPVEHKQINFPNSIIQSMIIAFLIVVINSTSGLAPFIASLCLFVLWTLLSILLKSESALFHADYLFCLLCFDSISLAFMIAYITNQLNIVAVCSCITLFILYKTKDRFAAKQTNYSSVLTASADHEITVEEIMSEIRNERIIKAFKSAVVLSRKKSSHRNELIINILKRKCYYMECESRGSSKQMDSLLLLEYEVRIIQIIKKTLTIQEKAVETLSIIKKKEPKHELFIQSVVELIDLINENKTLFIQCMKINFLASELTVLMYLFFKQLYNDGVFLRESKAKFKDFINQAAQKQLQKQLFSKDTALIVIKVIDEVGKITKVSNNIPNVLGYASHSLVGLSINELIPLSIREIHDSILNNFVANVSSETMRQKPKVQFYAYDKLFHLQKVEINYKFFLHCFETFQLSSVMRKLKTEDNLIMVDEFGNIEGWSAQVGETLNFDELSANDCTAYNVCPLLPAYIKYDSREPATFRTIFFRLSKMKTNKLMVMDSKKQRQSIEDIRVKQLETFLGLLGNGDIIEAYFVNIEIVVKHVRQFNKIVKIIKLFDMKRIENFERLESAILDESKSQKDDDYNQFGFSPDLMPQKSFDQSEDADFSILKGSEKECMTADLNFSLDKSKPNALEISELKYNKDTDRFQSIFSTRSLLKLDVDEDKEEVRYMSDNLIIESNYDPKLERRSNFLWLLALITIVVLALIIEDEVTLSSVAKSLKANTTQIQTMNRIQMIHCKTTFNPNRSYIREFDNGKLLVLSTWLYNQKYPYLLSTGDQVSENLFYLLNVQVPTTLSLVERFENETSDSNRQLASNFYGLIEMYDGMYQKLDSSWSQSIDLVKRQEAYKTIVYAVGAAAYILFLIYVLRRYKSQRKMTEAFFKFERNDLDIRISSIKTISTALQKRCEEWFIDQYMHEIKKNKLNTKKEQQEKSYSAAWKVGQPQTMSARSQQEITSKKVTVVADPDEEMETEVSKRRYHFIVGMVICIVVTQLLFLVLRSVLINKMLSSYSQMIKEYDQVNKLIVYPNLLMANSVYTAPPEIIAKYQQAVQTTLNEPIEYMPEVYELLSTKPCSSCPFLAEILNTNYRSFYSYFIQRMASFSFSDSDATTLYLAVDVVVQNIANRMAVKEVPIPTLVILVYVISVVAFFVSTIIITRQLEEELSKLQCFLKFLHMEALLKNKHMSTVMAKNM